MKKEELYFDSRDGVNRIHAVRYIPDNGEIRGILQIVHGMSEYIERYEDIAEYMTARGFIVTGDDHMGHGKTVVEGGKYGHFCELDPATVLVRDVHRLKKMNQEIYPGVPYFILGHSMGSFITRNYIMRYGTGIKGAIIMGTGMQTKLTILAGKTILAITKLFHGSGYISKMLNDMAFSGYNKRIKNKRTEFDWLSVNEANVDKYIADPLCGFPFTLGGFAGLFELINRLLSQENINKVPASLPIFMVAGAEDPVGSYGAGVEKARAMLEKAGVKDLSMKLYPGDRHEILNEDDRDTVKEDIYNWITARL